jgi:putative membrane protein
MILQIIISSLAIYFTAWLLPGIEIKSYPSAILVAIVLGLLNVFLKPVLQFLSFPLTIVTFGLFLLVINALIILLTSTIIGSFRVENFWWALLFSIIVTVVTEIMEGVVNCF